MILQRFSRNKHEKEGENTEGKTRETMCLVLRDEGGVISGFVVEGEKAGFCNS